MEINDYAKWTDKVWKSGEEASRMDDKDLSICALGLAGETGEALEYIKKYLRDGKDPRGGARFEEMAKEMGDIAFYWVRIAKWLGLEPSQILDRNVRKLEERHADRLKR